MRRITTWILATIIMTTLLGITTKVSACAVVETVWSETNEDLVMFYDFNSDGTVNVLDYIAVKNEVLGNDTLTALDLFKLKNYLISGEVYFDFREIDADEAEENELESSLEGVLVQHKYDDGVIRLRHLKDGTITETRFNSFSVSDGYYKTIYTKDEYPLYNIGRDSETNIFSIGMDYVLDNAIESDDINDIYGSEVLYVLEDSMSTTFFINRETYIQRLTLKHTQDPTRVITTFVTPDYCAHIICIDKDGELAMVYGTFAMQNHIPLATSNIDLRVLKKINGSYAGELVSYIPESDTLNMIIKNSDGSLFFSIVPEEFGDCVIIINSWELDGYKYVLGIDTDGVICWDTSSHFGCETEG